jgi:chromosome partitioning protein
MLGIDGSLGLRRIVVINPKGGAGKTTLAFNLAGYLAATKRKVALVDMDQQGSSSHWLGRRPAEFPPIHGVSASSVKPSTYSNLGITLPPDIDFVVVDAPAGVSRNELANFTVGSHAIIVPVMPSELDIHAASRLIADLLRVARVSRENGRLGVIANRVKERTIAYRQLMKFLERVSIPVIGVIRDSQNYVSAAREGLCIHELPASKAAKDLKRWEPVIQWLDQRLETPLNERDLLRAKSTAQADEPTRRPSWKLATAAALLLIAASVLLWNIARTPDTDVPVSPVAAIPEAEAPHDDAGDARLLPASDAVAAVSEKPSEPEVAEAEFEEPESLPTPDTPHQKSQPSGVVQSGPDAVAIDQAVHEDVGDARLPPASDGVTIVAEKPPEPAVAEPLSEEQEHMPDTPRQKWQLRGVAKSGEAHVVLLTDISNSSTRTVTEGIHVDGWLVKEAGRDFVVLAKNGEEVRLRLIRQGAESQMAVSP